MKDIDNEISSSTSDKDSEQENDVLNLENIAKAKRFTYAILGKPKNCLKKHQEAYLAFKKLKDKIMTEDIMDEILLVKQYL